ncbi:MAG: RES family NAD+ phosphorylase [Candidatus Eremiobacteraeota bacterium]|nr:RES family NAD+ phosphorylase [Candidatus Eremiobacteraeota bacterium]MBC5801752.1 RES family NAD+ phosphorylase [Candidatus Eremiobacteraeota bacterium]MBC5820856.1 RES family NAD+ phosphorylase [Candidatus Eremiobacteraeota bacterium]
MRVIGRGGTYLRVAKPEWTNPLDTSFSKVAGGRWNPPTEFGALYLNRTLDVAAANARWQHRGRAIGLFDLQLDRRPILISLDVPLSRTLDVVTDLGLRGLRLPSTYPYGIGYERCRPIGRRARNAGLAGVACRSSAESTGTRWLGEELAWFDHAPRLSENAPRLPFHVWYPDLTP